MRTEPPDSGERKAETEEKHDNVYRCERSNGSFYRAVPFPEGAKIQPSARGYLDASLTARILEIPTGRFHRIDIALFRRKAIKQKRPL